MDDLQQIGSLFNENIKCFISNDRGEVSYTSASLREFLGFDKDPTHLKDMNISGSDDLGYLHSGFYHVPTSSSSEMVHIQVKPMADKLLCILTREGEGEAFVSPVNGSMLATISNNLREGLYCTTMNGEIEYVNDGFLEMFGYQDNQEVLKKNSDDFYVDVKQRFELKEMLSHDSSANNLEVLFKKKSGETFWGLMSLYKVQGWEKVYLYGVIRNINHIKDLEKQLRLEKERALRATEVKERFLSTVSHELRTPLNAVLGMAGLLMSNNPRQDQLEHLQVMQHSGKNLLFLINDILDISKIQRDKVQLMPSSGDLSSFLEQLMNVFIQQPSEKDIAFNLELCDIPKQLLFDQGRLGQVLNNLIGNAIKFTFFGEVRLKVSCTQKIGNKLSLRFEVKDTGVGISKEKQEMIFESFQQVSNSTTRAYGGTGLGLTIAKELVELLGGKLTVESELGLGSVFSFEVPFLMPVGEEEKTKKEQSKSVGSLSGLRILAVEDNLVNQVLLRHYGKSWNVNMAVCANGLEAITIIENQQFDLVLMDIQMPVMDGFTAARSIRSMKGEKGAIPIIAVTASNSDEIKSKVEASGMNRIVAKPYEPEDLEKAIIEILG